MSTRQPKIALPALPALLLAGLCCGAAAGSDSPVHAVATWKRSAPGQAGSARVVAAWSVDASQLRFRDIDPARVHCTRDESRD